MVAWSAIKEYMEMKLDGMCEICLETPAKLHVHHKNGCGLDNRLENLRAVCPSCHRKLHGHNLGRKAVLESED